MPQGYLDNKIPVDTLGEALKNNKAKPLFTRNNEGTRCSVRL